MKVVINKCYGGFGLSKKAKNRYAELKKSNISEYDIPRNDPILIQVIEELDEEANGFCAKLKIIEIPNDIKWTIEEYDGIEWVAEKHRTWGDD